MSCTTPLNTIMNIVHTLGVAISLGILGTTYCDLGELLKAEQLLQKSVDINRRVNGPKHIGTGIAQTLLGRVERLAGKLQSARKTLESALEIKEAVHGSDHPGKDCVIKFGQGLISPWFGAIDFSITVPHIHDPAIIIMHDVYMYIVPPPPQSYSVAF